MWAQRPTASRGRIRKKRNSSSSPHKTTSKQISGFQWGKEEGVEGVLVSAEQWSKNGECCCYCHSLPLLLLLLLLFLLELCPQIWLHPVTFLFISQRKVFRRSLDKVRSCFLSLFCCMLNGPFLNPFRGMLPRVSLLQRERRRRGGEMTLLFCHF